MTTSPAARVLGRSRRILPGVVAGVVGLGLTGGLLVSPAVAADGPAPAPTDRTVLADVHTDAIATFWDDGELVLDTRADVPALGTRYDADSVWFHVDDDSRIDALPAGHEFLADAGSTVWLAPQVQQSGQIWPGFSTESVPAGTLDGDDTTFTLVDVDGPGEVELWLTGTFGGIGSRIWSSDEDFKSFTRKRVHMHANWGFTQPGVYDLTVRADAAVGGTPVSDTQVYTFVVGELPEQVQTTTTLEVSASDLVAGDPLTLDARVDPAGAGELGGDVAGAVEFRSGDTVLGHDPVEEDGSAELTVPDLAVGTHAITAAFVPTTANLATRSTSEPVTVTVTDGSGVPFGIRGVEETYQPGDVLDARVVGHTLGDDEMYLWVIRPIGADDGYVIYGDDQDAAFDGHLTQVVDTGHDGYEIQVDVVDRTTWRSTGSESPWVPIAVADAPDVDPISAAFPEGTQYLGDDIVLPLSRALEAGESARLVYRSPTSPWFEVDGAHQVDNTVVARPSYALGEVEFSVQVIRDGAAVTQSAPVVGVVESREVLVEGVRGVYRVGQTLQATATVHPQKDGLTHRWLLWDGEGDVVTVKEGTTAEALSLELPMTTDLDGVRLYFETYAGVGTDREVVAGTWSTVLKVSDADPDTQLLFFESLGGHYHQGYDIDLDLVADPELAEGDTIAWEWRWPGGDWATFPGASGMSHRLVAEQALDGVEVRATLDFGDSDETLVTEPVTIHNDDHGSPARQQPTVDAPASVTEGDSVTLAMGLPDNGATVLTDHRWEKKVAGGEWTVLEGASGRELSFEAALADDRAEFRVSILKPTGEVAYGPSPAVSLAVTEDPTPDPTDPTHPTPVPTPTPAPTPVPTPAPAPAPAPGPVVKAEPRVKVKAPTSVRRGAKVRIRLVVRARGEEPTGKVRVKVAGRARTLRLDDRGRATVTVRIPRSTRPGKKKVVVTYLGDDAVARDKQRTTVRVTR